MTIAQFILWVIAGGSWGIVIALADGWARAAIAAIVIVGGIVTVAAVRPGRTRP